MSRLTMITTSENATQKSITLPLAPCTKQASYGRSSYQLGTHLNNPSEEEYAEIEVTDPAHPLFGRRFPLLSVSGPARPGGSVFVSYRDYMVLRIETAATDLAPDTRSGSPTKLTSQSVAELVELADQCEVLCPTDHTRSGEDSPPDSRAKS